MPGSMNFIRTSWRFLGNASLSLWLIYALFAEFLIGSIIMRHHPSLFHALKDMTLQQWVVLYGASNLGITWWFLGALILLFLLALTTSVCGTDKLIATIGALRGSGLWRGLLKLSPSIIHLGFLLLLLGQLVSHTLGINQHGNILATGGTVTVPGSGMKITLKDLNVDFFGKGTRFLGMDGSPRDCTGVLSIIDAQGHHDRVISINRPVWYKGWSFFIEDFYPKSRGVIRPPFINMVIRKDPGISLMVAGAIVFGLGLIMHLLLVTRSRISRGRGPVGVSMSDGPLPVTHKRHHIRPE